MSSTYYWIMKVWIIVVEVHLHVRSVAGITGTVGVHVAGVRGGEHTGQHHHDYHQHYSIHDSVCFGMRRGGNKIPNAEL